MARLSRFVVPGYPHHVTQRAVRSMDLFHSEADPREYLGMLGEEIARYGVAILVWCPVTDHVHFVAVPHPETSLEDDLLRKLPQATRTGRPAGDVAFLATVEKLTGRDLSKGRPGRPGKRPL
jgi:putative transposase